MEIGSTAMVALAICFAGATIFFWLANRATRQIHAAFGPKEVVTALQCVLDDSECHDEWDLFLSWPIDDPHLESIRQQCHEILRTSARPQRGEDISEDGKNRVRTLLRDLRERS
jgi:hypothetical protein